MPRSRHSKDGSYGRDGFKRLHVGPEFLAAQVASGGMDHPFIGE